MPLEVGLKVLADACAGLHYAHEAVDDQGKPLDIVHRDFSPDNIHLTFDGRVKVMDFGIAKALAVASQSEPGTLKGKYFYMSPEMVLGEPLDRRADVFAAGVILYELLSDRRPFEGENPREILALIARCAVIPPSQVNPDAPADLEALALRCLARAPDDRPQTARDVRAAIEAHLLAGGGSPSQAELGAYLEHLFPKSSDPERQRFEELKRLEPSWPSARVVPSLLGHTRLSRSRFRWVALATGVVVVGAASGAALVLGTSPTDPAQLYRKGIELTKTDPTAAARLLRKAAKATPEDPKPAMALLAAMIASEDYKDAETLAEKWTSKRPDLVPAHLCLGDAYRGRRQGAKAEAEYNLATQLAPKDPEPWRHLGELRLAMGDYPKAQEAFERARSLGPGDPKLMLKLAQVKMLLSDWGGAATLLAHALAKAPDDAELRSELGYALYRKGDNAKALAELTAVAKKHPEFARAHYYLGFALYSTGETQKAIEAYREAFARDPKFADAHVALADLYAQESRRQDAAKEYKQALKIDSKNEAAAAGLKQVK